MLCAILGRARQTCFFAFIASIVCLACGLDWVFFSGSCFVSSCHDVGFDPQGETEKSRSECPGHFFSRLVKVTSLCCRCSGFVTMTWCSWIVPWTVFIVLSRRLFSTSWILESTILYSLMVVPACFNSSTNHVEFIISAPCRMRRSAVLSALLPHHLVFLYREHIHENSSVSVQLPANY